jgi:uncharacterized protein YuzE
VLILAALAASRKVVASLGSTKTRKRPEPRLYLHVGEPQAAAEREETPEQHIVRFDQDGQVIGLTIIDAKWLLDRDGAIAVTLPELQRVDAEELEPALRAA